MAKSNRYKLVGGPHEDGPVGGVVQYKKGDVVESDKPLDVMFPNKFVRLMGKKGEDDDIDITTPAGKRKLFAREPSEAQRREALEEANVEAMEEAAEADDTPRRKPLMKRVKGDKAEPGGERRGQHAKAGQEGGSFSDEELQPEEDAFGEDEDGTHQDDVSAEGEEPKPRRRGRKKRAKE